MTIEEKMAELESSRDHALALAAMRPASWPTVEMIVPGVALVTVPIDVSALTAGARECIERGLSSLWNADDASTLIVYTGKTLGEMHIEENAELARRETAAPMQNRGLLHAYGHDAASCADTTPAKERVQHTITWRPLRESPEDVLNAALSRYAGRIVRAGLSR